MVTLDVAKGGAIFHGLAALLSQPSPLSGGPHPGALPPGTGTTYQAPPSQQPTQMNMGVWLGVAMDSP